MRKGTTCTASLFPHRVAVVGLIKPNDEVRVRHEEDVLLCDDAILSTGNEMIQDRGHQSQILCSQIWARSKWSVVTPMSFVHIYTYIP